LACDGFIEGSFSMNRGEKFSLPGMRIHLSDGPGVEPVRGDAASWKRVMSDRALSAGRMLGVETVLTDDDVHASKWERHVLVGVTRHADTQHRDVKAT
jgi:hypothetical protein